MAGPRMVPVKDSKNHGRLLGHIDMSGFEVAGRLYRFPVFRAPDLLSYSPQYDDSASFAIDFIDLEIIRRECSEAGGWIRITELQLATSAPLRDLMLLPNFQLPGESSLEARERRRRSLYAL